MDECFSQPVTGVAGRTILLLDRISPDYNHTQIFTGSRTRALNISSYNYLGFAQGRGGCADAVEEAIKRYGISTCGSRLEGGSSDIHTVTEALVAKFVGMEDALISSMGFATNSTFIPALVGKGCLVISDELNHASIRFGVRISNANVRMFKHNDMESLEALLREVISQGQPKTHRPWKKILLAVEGLYSMEGTLVNLPRIMELKQKYKVCKQLFHQSQKLPYQPFIPSSFTSSLMKHIRSALSVLMDEVLRTTLVSTQGRSIFLWVHSQSHSVRQEVTSPETSRSLIDFGFLDTPVHLRNR